jgi:hypothetical protein
MHKLISHLPFGFERFHLLKVEKYKDIQPLAFTVIHQYNQHTVFLYDSIKAIDKMDDGIEMNFAAPSSDVGGASRFAKKKQGGRWTDR